MSSAKLKNMLLVFMLVLLSAIQAQSQSKKATKQAIKRAKLSYCLPANYSLREILRGRIVDDSSHIYALPYERGRKKVLMVQGYDTKFSHRGELSVDFKMRTGTKICAARSGLVIASEGRYKRGGLKKSYLPKGNHIVILHDDGTVANYWHFAHKSVFVSVGDTVSVGQVIGLCGNTGYSAFPHLHFDVSYSRDSEPIQRTMPTRFATDKGVKYLRMMRRYRH